MFLSLYLFLLIELVFVSWIDYKTKKISNWWPLINLGFFGLLLLVFPGDYLLNFEIFFYPAVFLGVGFCLFAMNIMGAGDVKYLASFFLLVPAANQDRVFYFLLYTTTAVGILLLFYNTVGNFDKLKEAFRLKSAACVREVYGKNFSYAPVIGLAWIGFGWSIKFY